MHQQTAKQILENNKKVVWPKIKKYLSSPQYPPSFRVPKKYKKELDFYWQIIRDYPSRQGKYLRPTLVLLTCAAMGGDIKKAVNTAAAMQVSEDWLLIHDDFEDNSIERRGNKTLHRIYGNEQAINAGDALQIIMWKLINDNFKLLGIEKACDLADEFYKMLLRTTIGQSVEMKWFQEDKRIFTDEDWLFVANSKSSYYTIAGPMRLGAIISGANRKQLESISEFGSALGICFQLIDDILDITSDFAGQKKQRGNDIFEGKKTVILGHLLRSAQKEDLVKIKKILKKTRDQKNQSEVDSVIKMMEKYKSVEYAKNIAAKYKKRAEKIFLNKLGFLSSEPARTQIQEISKFILNRDH